MSDGVAYLHVGLPKTGTTSLQAFFRANRDVLNERGVVYPDTTGRDVGNATPAALALDGEFPEYFRATHPRYASGSFDFASLWRELVAHAEAGKALLLSSEELGGVPAATLRRLTEFDGLTKHVIIYLRRQDLLIEGAYRQEVMAGLVDCPFDDYVASVVVGDHSEQYLFEYQRLVSGLLEWIGRNRIHVILYDEPTEPEWIYESALRVLGLSLGPEYTIPPVLNRSPHPLVVETVRRASVAGRWHLGLVDAVTKSALRLGLLDGQPWTLLTPRDRQLIQARFSHGNAWVARLFFHRPRLFTESDAAQPRPVFRPDAHAAAAAQLERECSLVAS